VDEHTISPAGDPFHAAPHDQDERPHACNDGWITLGELVVDPETGEESDEHAPYLCSKCAERSKGVESAARAGASYGVQALSFGL
jgi:hypothetical protein